jgi:hypothetical protein
MSEKALPRLFAGSVRRIGPHTLAGLALLGLLLGSAAFGLNNMLHGRPGAPLVLNALLAMLLGWWLARTRLPGWPSAILLVLCGLLVVASSAAQMGRLLFLLSGAALDYTAAVLLWRAGQPLANPGRLLLLLEDAAQRSGSLSAQASAWLIGALRGAAAYDAQSSALVWGLLLWGVAAWAAWGMRRRRQPLLALLPALALFAASLAFSRAQVALLVPALGAALALLAWNQYGLRSRAWRQEGLDYAEDIALESGMWAGGLVLGIVTLAWWLSAFSPQQALRFARDLAQPRSAAVDQLGQALGLPEGSQPVPARETGYMPRQHLLGAGPELSKQVVFLARLLEPQNGWLPPGYWKLATYDIYTGAGWSSGTVDTTGYRAGQAISQGQVAAWQELHQEVQWLDPNEQAILQMGELQQVDQAYQVAWRPTGNTPDAFDARLLRPPRGGKYRARSWVSLASQEQLRTAGSEIPEEIARRYLDLPSAVPPRVTELALQITRDAATLYDKARAIESTLRRIPYSLDVPAPPAEQDAADYFLFDLQRGYCDYYATAMVVLARAAGLPARLAIGYAPGTAGPATDSWVVTQADAHSWVEIYFPQYGWIPFEPTGGRPPLERDSQPLAAASADPASPPAGMTPWPMRSGLAWALLAVFLLGIAAWFAWNWLDTRRLRRLAGPVQLSTLYTRLRQQGQRLGIAPYPGETPHEFAVLLSHKLAQAVKERPAWPDFWRRWLIPATGEARRLVELYTQAAYSQRPPDSQARRASLSAWQKLRWRLWLAGWPRTGRSRGKEAVGADGIRPPRETFHTQ